METLRASISVYDFMKVLVIAMLTAAWGQAQENAVSLLQRASEVYKNAKSYHFESVRQTSISSDLHHSWSESFETLAAIVPENKVRFESREHTGWYVVASDGKTMWRAVPYTREYARTNVTGPLLETKGGGPEAEMALRRLKLAASKYDRLDENLKSAQVIRNEVVESGREPNGLCCGTRRL